jgi:hypothetical protein
LARTVKRAAIFQVSAVQVDSDAQGKRVPRPNFAPWQVEMPLRWCLDQIHIQREIEQQHAFAEEQRRMREMADFAEERAARKINRVVAGIVVTMIVVATCLLLLWWTFKT